MSQAVAAAASMSSSASRLKVRSARARSSSMASSSASLSSSDSGGAAEVAAGEGGSSGPDAGDTGVRLEREAPPVASIRVPECRSAGSVPADSGPLAHRVEQGTFNPKVPGSSPGRPTARQARKAEWPDADSVRPNSGQGCCGSVWKGRKRSRSPRMSCRLHTGSLCTSYQPPSAASTPGFQCGRASVSANVIPIRAHLSP